MYPPSVLCFNLKNYAILLEENIQDHYLGNLINIFWTLIHNFHTGFHWLLTWSAMLRSLIDSLVLRIDLFTVSSHPSEEQTLAKQHLIFICVQVHGFKNLQSSLLQKGFPSSMVLLKHLLEVKGSIQNSHFNNSQQTVTSIYHQSVL